MNNGYLFVSAYCIPVHVCRVVSVKRNTRSQPCVSSVSMQPTRVIIIRYVLCMCLVAVSTVNIDGAD